MIITAAHTDHYATRRPIGTAFDLETRVNAARDLAGLPPVSVAEAVDAHLATEPTLDALLVTLADETASSDDLDVSAWTADALARVQRAQAADALRAGLRRHRERTMQKARPRVVMAAAQSVTPAFAETVARLKKAAAALPAGDAPLDTAAILANDSTRELKTATACLTELATFAGIHAMKPYAEVPPAVGKALAVLDFPTVPRARFNRLNGQRIDDAPHAERDAVTRLVDDAQRHGLDAVLVNVARGQYAGVSLALAASPVELAANAARLVDALVMDPEAA